MLKFVILSTLIACALGAVMPKGMLPQINGRIVNGEPTSIRSTPWQISLQRGGFHSCGGSIIGERTIVTAAHCLQNIRDINVLRVRVGSSLWISGGKYLSVSAYKNHEGYSPYYMTNDIAIMKLSSPLVFSSTMRPIELAKVTPKDGAPAIVSGWGTTQSGANSSPTQLKVVEMKIVDRSKCASEAYLYGTIIAPSMICTYSVGKDSCQGDSGGPLVSGGKLVGVVSWGIGCAYENFPGVYSNVAELYSWVETNADKI